MWASPGFTKFTSNYIDMLFDPAANAEWCEFIADKIRGIVDDPTTAEQLIPSDHRFGEKRPPFVTGYFEAFNQPNVSLVDLRDTPIVRVTETGIETTDGGARARRHRVGDRASTSAPARCSAWASGAATASRSTDHWADGPTTFLGIQTAGFPNLFFPGGPHAAAGNNPRYNGDQVDFVTDTLVYAPRPRLRRDRGQPRGRGAVDRDDRQGRVAARRSGRSASTSGGNIPGKPRRYLLNAGGRPKLFKEIARVKRDRLRLDFRRWRSG